MVVRSLLLALFVMLLSCTSSQTDKTKAQNSNTVSAQKDVAPESLAKDMMIYFEGGSFMMGSDKGTPQEQPIHQVEVKSFKIDKYPVTVGEFRQFVEAPDLSPPKLVRL